MSCGKRCRNACSKLALICLRPFPFGERESSRRFDGRDCLRLSVFRAILGHLSIGFQPLENLKDAFQETPCVVRSAITSVVPPRRSPSIHMGKTPSGRLVAREAGPRRKSLGDRFQSVRVHDVVGHVPFFGELGQGPTTIHFQSLCLQAALDGVTCQVFGTASVLVIATWVVGRFKESPSVGQAFF